MSFREFLETYNFRYVNDFGEEESKMEICESVLNKEIMESYVESISMNPDLEKVVTVYLRKKE